MKTYSNYLEISPNSVSAFKALALKAGDVCSKDKNVKVIGKSNGPKAQ